MIQVSSPGLFVYLVLEAETRIVYVGDNLEFLICLLSPPKFTVMPSLSCMHLLIFACFSAGHNWKQDLEKEMKRS